ncbi:hypothetical protein KGY58_05630 [Candidatus Bipolaricaulota bacterium]|nr:hypothetical protein [Candidatus Bipolaricaulota bacterium]
MEIKLYDAVLIGSGFGKKAIQAVLNQNSNGKVAVLEKDSYRSNRQISG